MKWLKNLFSDTVFNGDYRVASSFYNQLKTQIDNFYKEGGKPSVTIRITDYVHGEEERAKVTKLIEKYGLPHMDKIKINKRAGFVFSIFLN